MPASRLFMLSCVLAGAMGLMVGVLQAGDWPGLRGAQLDGVAVGESLAESWPVDGPPVLWSRELGQGYSSFAVVGDLAYTQSQNALGQYVICLELDTGHTVWETRVGAAYELVGIYPGPRSTPAVSEGVVYYTTPDGEVGALDALTGRLRWTKSLQADLKGEGTEFGYSASPIITDQRLFLPIGGPQASVVALALPAGEIAWQSGSQPASYCSSYPVTLKGQPLLVSYLQNHLVIQDRTTGNQLWQTELSVGYDEHSCMPVYREPILVVSAPFQAGSTAYQLEWKPTAPASLPELSVKQLWQQPKFSLDVDSATVVGETIYGFDVRDPQSKAHRPSRGEFRALNISDGKILWSSKTLGQANIVAVGSELLLLNDAGELIRIRAETAQYTELGRVKLFEDEVCWTPPALSSGVLLVRSHSRAIALRVGSPVEVGPTAPVAARPRRWLPSLAGLSALLLQGEREHPFMRPEQDELLRWFTACLGAALFPLLLFVFAGWRLGNDSGSLIRQLQGSLLATALLGGLATPLLNWLEPEQFTFSWPVSLLAMFQSAILASVVATRTPDNRAARYRSYLTGAGWLVTCIAFFLLLRQASLPHEWGFLIGFIPAAPLAIWAARLAARGAARARIAAVVVLGYFAGFWGAVLAPQLMS